jgi:glycosyltransferase involved in cell wall biosynthesis
MADGYREGRMKAESLPLVSIVTPLYNEKKYLSECVESVLAQTYPNWEYIIVDNCSTDGSGEIARKYAEKDPRIRVYENSTFLQAMSNHNSALRWISPQSKYCKIVFADDWIFPECLERMVGLAEEHPSIGIVGAYVLEGQKVICTGLPYETKLVDGRDICRQHFLNKLYVFGSANAVLYRADLVRNNHPFFNEANIHGDTEVCFTLLKDSDFGFVHQILTFTRVRLQSLSAISSDLQTSLAGMLQLLIAHGPSFLRQEELEKLLRLHISLYYRFLGKSLLLGHHEKLAYHKKKLMDAGVGFSWTRVVLGLLSGLRDLALNPKSSTQKFLKRNDARGRIDREKDLVAGPAARTLQGEL